MTRSLSELSWPRRTARLGLRPPVLADLPAIYAYRSDPDTGRWLTAIPGSVEEMAPRFLGSGTSLVVEREDEIVGDLMLQIRDSWAQREVVERASGAQADLGWCIAPAHQHQGYAVEAVRELITVAFELGARRVSAECFAENIASRRVMEKVGLRQEGHYRRDSLHRDGTWRDGMSFALLSEEWADGS